MHLLRKSDVTGTMTQGVTSGPITYFGGRVISNVNVVEVLYGTGTYIPEVNGSPMANFYAQVTNSPHLDWLTEYNTPAAGGTNQTIGRGSFGGKVRIAPSIVNNGSTIDDDDLRSELLAQIGAGSLPAPTLDAAGNANTVYMVHFPAGKTITVDTYASCASFCAYHGAIPTQHLYYAVLPDFGPGSPCAGACGGSTTFNNQTSVASHELLEAITDPEPYSGWHDASFKEIGDLCNHIQGTFVGIDGVTYTVQKEWSNAAAGCIVTAAPRPTCSLAFSQATVPSGGSVSFTLTSSGPIPAGSRAHLTGTKNGWTDVFDQDYGPPAFSQTLTNAFGLDGTYGRTITIVDPNGQFVCQTNEATVVFQPPTCTASFNKSTVPSGGSATFAVQTLGDIPIGSRTYLYGTKNGVTDVNGIDYGPPTFSQTVTNPFGFDGTYVRWVVVRTPSGQTVCSTESAKATVRFLAPTCALSFSKSVVPAGGSVQFALASQGDIPAGSRAYLYGYKNNVTDETGGDIGPPNFNYTIVNSPGLAGSYTRWVIVRTTDGRRVCQSSPTSTIFQ